MSSSSVVSLSSFNLLFFTQVLTVLTSSLKYNDYVTDKGKNISIPCLADGNVMWVKESGNSSTIVQTGKFLVLTNVSVADRGLYVCFASVPLHRTSTATSNSNNQSHSNSSSSDSNLPLDAGSSETTPPSSPTSTGVTSASGVSASSDVSQGAGTTPTTPTSTLQSASVSASNATSTSPLPVLVKANALDNISYESNNHYYYNYNARDNGTTQEYQAFKKFNLTVRTTPGPVTQLYFKPSTVLGFLVWRYNKSHSGGYPLKSFTAEYRNVSYAEVPYNSSFEHEWIRMDPVNIAFNVRQMEVYRLATNTTYEFRIWANNQLGSGDVTTTNVTTLPETNEEDLIRLIQPDLDQFDGRVWIIAVSVVLGTLVILAVGLCIVMSKECYQATQPHGIETNFVQPDDTSFDVVVVYA